MVEDLEAKFVGLWSPQNLQKLVCGNFVASTKECLFCLANQSKILSAKLFYDIVPDMSSIERRIRILKKVNKLSKYTMSIGMVLGGGGLAGLVGYEIHFKSEASAMLPRTGITEEAKIIKDEGIIFEQNDTVSINVEKLKESGRGIQEVWDLANVEQERVYQIDSKKDELWAKPVVTIGDNSISSDGIASGILYTAGALMGGGMAGAIRSTMRLNQLRRKVKNIEPSHRVVPPSKGCSSG